MKRYKAEYPNGNSDYISEENIKSEIEKIKEELFNIPFEEAGKDIVSKF